MRQRSRKASSMITPVESWNYAPVSHAKFVRDVIVGKDYLPSPAKRPRAEHYYEEYEARKQPVKHVHNVADRRPVEAFHPSKVIEKKPVLHAIHKDEWDEIPPPKPKRVRTRIRRNPNPQQELTNTTSNKPVDNLDTQDAVKVAPASKATDAEGKKAENEPTVEPNEDGLQELDKLTARILQNELMQIMGKVWQELSDDPPTEVEELVANKFRNEAFGDLQNAMGLNVTARLLNIHNPLYAKLHFSGKPEAGCLQAFIRKHKITAFKRITDTTRDIFAARFDRIQDFDMLCVRTQVKCGSATVTIIPCYKYFTSPPTLKSIYADKIAISKKQTSTVSTQKPDIDKSEKSVENAEVQTLKKNTEKESVAKPSKTTPTKTTTTADSKMPEKAVVVEAPAQEKPKQTVQEKPKQIVQEKPKQNVQEKPKQIVQEKPKPTVQEKPNQTIQEKPKQPVQEKPKQTVQEKPKQTLQEKPKPVVKETPKDVPVVPKKVAPVPVVPKKVAPVPVVTKKVTPKKVENNDKKKDIDIKNDKQVKIDSIDDMMVVDEEIGEEDDEEMTDQDILALMSGGIVLDECSGSDDEK